MFWLECEYLFFYVDIPTFPKQDEQMLFILLEMNLSQKKEFHVRICGT